MIFFIGMMGAGKSSIGKLLSKKTGLSFIDLDEEIVRKEGLSVNKVFTLKGERYFREIEAKILKTVKGSICACGGGIILNQNNVDFIKNHGISIFLNAEIEELIRRLVNSKDRPILKNKIKRDELEKIWRQRKKSYIKSADLILETEHKSKELLIHEIKILLQL
jgi:shikimate kinase